MALLLESEDLVVQCYRALYLVRHVCCYSATLYTNAYGVFGIY